MLVTSYLTFQELLELPKYQILRDTLMEQFDTPKERIQSVIDYFGQVHFFYNSDDDGYEQAGGLSFIISGLQDIADQHPEYKGKFQCLEITAIVHDDNPIPDAGYILYRFYIKEEYHKELPDDRQWEHGLVSTIDQFIESLAYGDDSCSWYHGFHNSSDEIIIYQEVGY